jgi:hypothetical protein
VTFTCAIVPFAVPSPLWTAPGPAVRGYGHGGRGCDRDGHDARDYVRGARDYVHGARLNRKGGFTCHKKGLVLVGMSSTWLFIGKSRWNVHNVFFGNESFFYDFILLLNKKCSKWFFSS